MHLPVLTPWLSADPILWWSGLAPPLHQLVPGNPGWIDGNAGVTTEALGHLAADDWLHGIVPWWNPYSGAGMPLAAEMQPSALFLPFVLLLHLPNGVLVLKIAMEVLTGLFTLALLRTLGIAASAALLVAIFAEFNGTFAWYAHAPIMPVAFLPLLLLGIERCRLAVRDRRRGGWALVAVAIAMSIYAGFPETAFLDALLGAIFASARLLTFGNRADRTRFAISLASGSLCGLLLAAPAAIPFLDYLPHAYLSTHADDGSQHLLPGSPAMLMLPYIFGTILFGHIATGTGQAYWWDAGGYIGLPLVVLAVFALLGRSRDPLRLALAAWLLASFAKAAGFPPAVSLWNLIPFVRQTLFPVYIAPSWEFSVLLLAALALDDWIRRPQADRVRATAALATALSLLAASLWFARPEILRLLQLAPHYRLIAAPLAGMTIAVAVAAGFLLAGRPTQRRVRALSLVVAFGAIANFAVPLLSATRAAKLDESPIAFLRTHLGLQRFYGIAVFGPNYGADERLASVNHNALPVPRDWVDDLHARLSPSMNGVEFFGRSLIPMSLQGDDAIRQALHPDLSASAAAGVLAGWGVRYVLAPHGVDPFTETAGTFLLLHDPRPVSLDPGASMSIVVAPPPALLGTQMTEAGVVIGTYAGRSDGSLALTLCSNGVCRHGRRDLRAVPDNAVLSLRFGRPLPIAANATLTVTLTHQGGTAGVAIYRWPAPTGPPAPLFVFRFKPPGPAPLRVFADPLIDIFELNAAAYDSLAASGRCHLTAVDRQRLMAACDAPDRLIRRELSFPGWHATINGHPVTLERSGLFQSVALPPGRSLIRFSYRPPFLTAACAAAALGLLWLLLSRAVPPIGPTIKPTATGHAMALLFLSLGLPTSIILALINPPFQGPDEGAHFLRAVQVGQGGFIATRFVGDQIGGKLPPSLHDLVPSFVYLQFRSHAGLDAAQLRIAEAQKWSGRHRRTMFLNTAIYPPWFYIPQAVAIDLGRAAGLHVLDCLTLARLASVASAFAVSAVAIATASAGAPLMAAILSLPMTLALFASCGQDALVIAVAALIASFLSRRIEHRASWAAWLGLGLATGAIGAARAPYVLFSALPLAVAARGPDRRRALAASIVGAVIALAWLRFGAGPLLAQTHAGGTVLGGAQMAFLRSHPLAIPRIALRTLLTDGRLYVQQFIGILNWLDVGLPFAFYRGVVVILVAVTILAIVAGRARVSPPRAAVATVLLAVTVSIFAALYLTWSPAGSPIVVGVQGRYVLPVALMTILLLRPGHALWPTRLATLLVAVLLGADLAVIPAAIKAHYGL